MDFNPKLRVAELFLAFVSEYISLGVARLATLGGEGLEAGLWQKIGLPAERGYLIECKRCPGRNLIRRFPFRFCSRLEYFPRMFQSVWGKHQGIDGFHLDLCGTLEASAKIFEPSFPLILRGRGKCLAVTVADQRRNSSVQHFNSVWAEASRILGEEDLESFFQALLAEQRELKAAIGSETSKPEIGAQRELGFAVRLIQALEKNRASLVDQVERYFYVSNRRGRPFRMRTYFFHFTSDRNRILGDNKYAWDTVKLWTASAIQVVNATGLKPIAIPTPAKGKEVVPMKEYPKYASLGRLAQAAGGPALKEFNALVADFRSAEKDAKLGRQVRAMALNGSGQQEVPVVAEEAAQPGKPAKGDRAETSIEVLLGLLRARAKGKKELMTAKKKVAKELFPRRKNGLRRVGTAFARTQGKFQAGFAKRVLINRPDLFPVLADLYDKDLDELRKEATAA